MERMQQPLRWPHSWIPLHHQRPKWVASPPKARTYLLLVHGVSSVFMYKPGKLSSWKSHGSCPSSAYTYISTLSIYALMLLFLTHAWSCLVPAVCAWLVIHTASASQPSLLRWEQHPEISHNSMPSNKPCCLARATASCLSSVCHMITCSDVPFGCDFHVHVHVLKLTCMQVCTTWKCVIVACVWLGIHTASQPSWGWKQCKPTKLAEAHCKQSCLQSCQISHNSIAKQMLLSKSQLEFSIFCPIYHYMLWCFLWCDFSSCSESKPASQVAEQCVKPHAHRQ